MNLNELIRNIPHEGGGDFPVEKIEYNSQKARAGHLFVCLSGAKRDGHDYAPNAYENGTRLFLCERPLDLPEDAVQVITPDTRSALSTISADFYGRPAEKLHVIGITGTKGKTTTSLLIASILNSSGRNCAYIGSNGVIINGRHIETVNTTPESLQLHHYFSMMVAEGVEYAVIEVSSQALVHNRVDNIPFEVTAFTNLYPGDHIGADEHADYNDYKNAKKRLFDKYDARFIVFNADDVEAEYMTENASGKKISFAMEKDADFCGAAARLYRNETSLGVLFECTEQDGKAYEVSLMSPGEFSVYNGLCAIAVCSCFGISGELCAKALAKTPVQGRFEIVEGVAGVTFVIDYSHNGLSLTKALKTLREYSPSRLICLFGSVGGRTQCRREEMALAASRYADHSVITSDNPDFEDPDKVISDIAAHMGDASYECIADRKEAIIKTVRMAREGDIVLFAGKGHETYQLICGEKVPFSEREIILDVCAEMAYN